MSCMTFTLKREQEETPLELTYQNLLIVGYSGRNRESILRHIRELEEQLGVPAPEKIPTIFSCSRDLLTQEDKLSFMGERCSGEVEYVIVRQDGRTYIGLGSDHTDRALETASVAKAKQICSKPICSTLWDYEELKDHWDDLILRSWYTVDGAEIPYQCGSISNILSVETILDALTQRLGRLENCVIFSGTVPLLNGYCFGSDFRCELADPVLNRSLCMSYHGEILRDSTY